MRLDFFVTLGGSAIAICLSLWYFRRYQLERPPVGVFNLRDVAILIGAIVVVPYVYLHLPLGVVSFILAVTVASAVYLVMTPVIGSRAGSLVAALLTVGGDVAVALTSGAMSTTFLGVNDVVLILVIIGVANLWVQSGMGAREVAVLAAMLAVYDYVATTKLTLMTSLLGRLSRSPFVPVIAWSAGRGVAIGLGDLLVAAAFPLAMRKSFGSRAATWALVTSLIVIASVLTALQARLITTVIPLTSVLGPLVVVEYLFWARRLPLRTTLEYLRAEPVRRQQREQPATRP